MTRNKWKLYDLIHQKHWAMKALERPYIARTEKAREKLRAKIAKLEEQIARLAQKK